MSGKRPVIQCLPVAPVPITRVLYSGRRRPTRLGTRLDLLGLKAEASSDPPNAVHNERLVLRVLCTRPSCHKETISVFHEVATDEVTVIAFCAIREMFADGACDASLDLCRRSSTPTVE
jgi:hypothetical protein